VHVLVKETSATGAANSAALTPATELSSVETRGDPPLAESRVTFRAACLVLIILLERVGYCVTSPRTRSRHAQLPLRRGATSVSGSRGTSRAPRCIIRRELSPFVAARFSFVYFRLFSFFFLMLGTRASPAARDRSGFQLLGKQYHPRELSPASTLGRFQETLRRLSSPSLSVSVSLPCSLRGITKTRRGENVCFDTRVTNDFRIYAGWRAGRPSRAGRD